MTASPDDGPEGGHDGRWTMSQLRTAWRRAAATVPAGTLADLLAAIEPAATLSTWACADLDVRGPRAGELRTAAATGDVDGGRLVSLAAGVTAIEAGVFEATWPGEDRPWLILRADGASDFTVATRSRALLDDLRRGFPARGDPAAAAVSAVAPEAR